LPFVLLVPFFGAPISPTDPVAALFVQKRVGPPSELQAMVAGESLFKEVIGLVLFSLLVSSGLSVRILIVLVAQRHAMRLTRSCTEAT
jgi:NhaP-type Na+/H+ or K+/H+ antiporter